MKRRTRAQSPFLPTPRQRDTLAPNSPLAMVLRTLPDTTEPLDGPLLETAIPAVIPGVRVELSEEQIAQALTLIQDMREKKIEPYAKNSRRGMRSDWRHWMAFCAQRHRVAMPISVEDLCEFIQALIEAGYKRATLEHLLFTLAEASRLWGCPNPADTQLWKAFWRDRKRERLTKRQHQAAPLNLEEVDQVLEKVDPESPRSIRDALFAACAYDMLARASELVDMRWDGITFDAGPDGGATYLLERAKGDQDGEGAITYLQPETVVLLRAWAEHRDPDNEHVFHALPRYEGHKIDTTRRLNVREASRIFDRLASRSGLGKALSGHSARVGAAQDMTRAGLDLPAIMQAGRWRSPQMPARYAANELATKVGKSRRAALNKLRK